MNDLRVAPLRPDQRTEGIAFYESQGYQGGIAPGDVVLGAWDGTRLVGLVRLTEEWDVHVLRGMFIHRPHQRQGLGTRMLEALVPHMASEDYWLICPDRLNAFYGRVGFEPTAPATGPAHLVERAVGYQQTARGTMNILWRPRDGSTPQEGRRAGRRAQRPSEPSVRGRAIGTERGSAPRSRPEPPTPHG